MSADRRQQILDKIMARVRVEHCGHMVNGVPSPCHLWTGPDSGKGRGGGYPRMNLDGATVAVHKVTWVIKHGPVPPRKQLDHECVMRRCVNPDHTKMRTHKQNQRLRDQRMKCEVVA